MPTRDLIDMTLVSEDTDDDDGDENYLVIKIEIIKEVKKSDISFMSMFS